jgi:putative hydrolase of the HAD superfamily
MNTGSAYSHIRYILFDLDDTLWDFEGNAEDALAELFHRHHLPARTGRTVESFVDAYRSINREYWKLYEEGKIDKHRLRTERFTQAFRAMGMPDSEHPENAWEEYLEICPLKTRLIPGAIELLEFLYPRFPMVVVTNGFEKVQQLKMECSGLKPYFRGMVSSESVGHPKPAAPIFRHAMQLVGAVAEQTLMIGDNLDTDIQGARDLGLDAIWFSAGKPIMSLEPVSARQVFSLDEIRALLA